MTASKKHVLRWEAQDTVAADKFRKDLKAGKVQTVAVEDAIEMLRKTKHVRK